VEVAVNVTAVPEPCGEAGVEAAVTKVQRFKSARPAELKP
jgi:hypothetical protein